MMISLGHKVNSDHIFIIHLQGGKLKFLFVYVDAIIIMGDEPIEKQLLQEKLVRVWNEYPWETQIFPWNCGVLHKAWYFISERKYTLDLLEEIGN